MQKQPRGISKGEEIEMRVREMSLYLIKNKVTIRVVAEVFKVSKSTAHKDVSERLWDIDRVLAKEVKKVLDYHKEVRNLRGGMATRKKYLDM